MNSRLCIGNVQHLRLAPVRNSFNYGVYYLLLDLAEVDELDASLRRFGHNHRALTALYDVDHGAHDGSPLRPWIDALLARVGIDLRGGRVLLLAIPRVLGERFYPVAFWYCFDPEDRPLAFLAEVRNTVGDHHDYLLHDHGRPLSWDERPVAAKAFYISPFVQREGVEHHFAFSPPDDRFDVSVDEWIEGAPRLRTTLSLESQELTDAALLRAVLRMGPMSARALVLIFWQALKLFLKRVPFHRHTPPSAEEVSM